MSGYRDTGDLRPQDKVDMDTYVRLGDRTRLGYDAGVAVPVPQPFFSGREAEITSFCDVLDQTAGGAFDNQTFLVEGAPGAGKSALLAQCADQVRRRDNDKEPWVALAIAASDILDPAGLAAKIEASVVERQVRGTAVRRLRDRALALHVDTDPGAARREIASVIDSARRVGPVAVETLRRQFRASVDLGIIKAEWLPERPPPRARTFERAALGYDWKGLNIVLLLDEAQNASCDSEASSKGVATAIHEGRCGARIVLAVFGLSGTSGVMAKLGVSRIGANRKFSLGGVPPEDAGKSIRRCFNHFAVSGQAKNVWEAEIANRSQGWPQHLTNYLQSAIAELAGHGYDTGRSSLRRALAEGDRLRRAYYTARKEAMGKYLNWAEQTARCLGREPEHRAKRERIREWMVERFGERVDREFDEFFDLAVHAGLLQLESVASPYAPAFHRHEIPIPSFRLDLAGEPFEPLPPEPSPTVADNSASGS